MVTELITKYHQENTGRVDMKLMDGHSTDEINTMIGKIADIFVALQFSHKQINGNVNYVMGDTYCIPQYVERLGFLVEYAHSAEEAAKNWYGDGDSFPLELGEEAILSGIRKELLNSIPELRHATLVA